MKIKTLLIITMFLAFCGCRNSASNQEKIDEKPSITNVITESFGEFQLVDSTSLFINNNTKYHIWIVKTNSIECQCRLYIFKEENNQINVTDTNDYMVDCSSANYSDLDAASLPFTIEIEDDTFIVVTTDFEKYIVNFDETGAYVNAITFFRKNFIGEEIVFEQGKLDHTTYGKVRVKELTESFFNKLEFDYQTIDYHDRADDFTSEYLIDYNIDKIKLPFSREQFLDDFYNKPADAEKLYPSSEPTNFLKDFLISKKYQGEEYKCYHLPDKNDVLVFLIHIFRGDSEYYVLITAKKDEIIDWKEMSAVIEDEVAIYFTISENFTIEKYIDQNNKKKIVSKLFLNEDGKIQIQK